jgi:hypothetical protein
MSYNVDALATDEVNVFCTRYFEDSPDLIAYCGLDDRRDADPICIWNQSRILDIVWWSGVSAFVCATNDAIYTATIQNGEFKIQTKTEKRKEHDHMCAWQQTATVCGYG